MHATHIQGGESQGLGPMPKVYKSLPSTSSSSNFQFFTLSSPSPLGLILTSLCSIYTFFIKLASLLEEFARRCCTTFTCSSHAPSLCAWIDDVFGRDLHVYMHACLHKSTKLRTMYRYLQKADTNVLIELDNQREEWMTSHWRGKH